MQFRKNLWQFLKIAVIGFVLFYFNPGESFAASKIQKTSLGTAHYTMGLIYDWQDNAEKAIEEYKQALKFDFTSAAFHRRLGIDYARTGKFDQAIAEFKSASKFDIDDLESRYLLAILYTSLKRVNEAAAQYEIILKKYQEGDPKNIQVFNYLGQLYFSQKKYDEAIKQYQGLLLLDSKNVDALFLLGILYEGKGARKEAIEFFKKAIEVNPKHADSLNSLGYIYAEDGKNLDEAKSLIEKALEIDPDNSAYIDSLGWVYFKKGMIKESLAKLETASQGMDDPEILAHLGEAYLKVNDKAKAIKAWQHSLELNPGQQDLKIRLKKLESEK